MRESLTKTREGATGEFGSGPDVTFAAALERGQFLIQRCVACEKHVFYPRVLCPHCGVGELAWVEPCGKGIVYSVTVVRRKPEQGGDYNVVLIDLEEGPRLMSRVEGPSPYQVHIGMRVNADLITEGLKKLLVFRPAQEAPV